MLRFIARRTLMTIPTLFLMAVSVCALIRLIPGDPAALMLGDMADPASLSDLRERLGLNQSLPVQFAIWFGNIVQGDFGLSITSGQPVLPLILDRFWISAKIVLIALLFSTLVAGGRRAKCWDAFKARYGQIASEAERAFLGEVGTDFSRTYEARTRRM